MLFSRQSRTADFEAAALPHLNEIYRTAARLLGDAARADDVVQDVFLQAWKSFDRFEPGTNCRAWLFKILFHSMNHYRRKWLGFRLVRESEEVLEQAVAAPPPPAAQVTDQEMLRALAAIPREFRAAVLLIDVEEFTYKEAAGILNVPIGTVMSRLSRGRKLLREKLAGMAYSYGIGALIQEGQTA